MAVVGDWLLIGASRKTAGQACETMEKPAFLRIPTALHKASP
jgi:hypothetical protein